MPEVQLFTWPDSGTTACVIALHEMGVPFENIQGNTEEGLAYLRERNPKAKLPTIIVDGQVITETPAVMTAIAQLAPEKHLLGKTPLDNVRVLELLAWLVGAFHGQAWTLVFRPELFSDDATMHDAIRAKGMSTLRELFGALEERVSGLYVAGDGMTVADAFLYVIYRWGVKWEIVNKEAHPKLCTAMTEFQTKASVKKTLEADNLLPVDV